MKSCPLISEPHSLKLPFFYIRAPLSSKSQCPKASAIPLSPYRVCAKLIYRKNSSFCSAPQSNNNLSDKFVLLQHNWNTNQFAVSNFNQMNKLHFPLQILTLTPPHCDAAL